MTKQTKQYIELSDIVALRFECKQCHTTLILPLGKDVRVENLKICPNCNVPWAETPNAGSMEKSLRDFTEKIQNIKEVIQRRNAIPGGFLMSLEILEPETIPTSASDRVANDRD